MPDGTQPGPAVAAAAGVFQKLPRFPRGALDFSGSSRRAGFSPYRGQHRIPLQRCAEASGPGPRTMAGFPERTFPGAGPFAFFTSQRLGASCLEHHAPPAPSAALGPKQTFAAADGGDRPCPNAATL
jgi:hypothetical protein